MKLKNLITSAGVCAALAMTLPTQAQSMKNYTIGSNPVGSNYYVIGASLAKTLTDTLKINSSVQPYSGSSIYLPLINAGQLAMGISSSLDSGMAYRADQGYEKLGTQKDLTALIHL